MDVSNSTSAIESFKKAIAINPAYAEAYNNLGNALSEIGKFSTAIKNYKKAIEIKPYFAKAYNNLGNCLLDTANCDGAIKYFEKSISIKPNFVLAINNLAVAHLGRFEPETAVKHLKNAIKLDPNFSAAYVNLSAAYLDLDDLDAASESCRKAIKLEKELPEAYKTMAIIAQNRGDKETAIFNYRKAIEYKSNFAEAHRGLSMVTNYKSNPDHLDQMLDIVNNNSLSNDQLCSFNFALGKAYEDISDFKKSFDYYRKGNSLRKKLLKYDISQDVKIFENLLETAQIVRKYGIDAKLQNEEIVPIFIVGMPRSGTTLIEQIISCHSDVSAAGEMPYIDSFGNELAMDPTKATKQNLIMFRDNYLQKLTNKCKGRRYITDKMPMNFKYIPLIKAAFPNARVIHVVREPIAICWSNFKTYFATKSGLGYSYHFEDIRMYFNWYRELMGVWRKYYPSLIYQCDYDKLTKDQETEIRKLIEAVGLNWQQRVV